MDWIVGDHLEQTQLYQGHALLLYGPAYVGKRTLARSIIAQQNCSGTLGVAGEACGQCASCRAFQNSEGHTVHPDLLWVRPRDRTVAGKAARRKLIPIGAILQDRDDRREYQQHVFEFLELQPTFRRKVVVLEGADHLGQEAANALLKLIEEPPHDALFILLAEDRRAVLPTIHSRSTPLAVNPQPDEALKQAGLPPELLSLAAGRLGVLEHTEAMRAALNDAEALNVALDEGLLSTLDLMAALEKRWTIWHPEALRLSWRGRSLAQQVRLDKALQEMQQALEAYANPALSFLVLGMQLRSE